MSHKVSKLLMLRQNGFKNFTVLSKNYSMEQPLLREDVDNGRKTIFTINRPKAFNSLTFKIVEEMYHTTKNLEKSKSLLIIKATENLAYCTGADLKQFSLAAKLGDAFYINNYSLHLNVLIDVLHTCKIPVVAFLNGFVFGSGSSIAVFPKYNIATEKTVFCMPEVRIGSAPNGGASYFFNNYTRGKLGYYLALTGKNLKGTDTVQAGLFKYYTESKNLKKIENQLVNAKAEDVKDVIEQNCEKNLPELSLTPYLEKIDKCFSGPSCNCKKGCRAACGCPRSGLRSSVMCLQCNNFCDNAPNENIRDLMGNDEGDANETNLELLGEEMDREEDSLEQSDDDSVDTENTENLIEPTVEGIISKLKEDGSKWALKTVSTMGKCSPLSLKVVLTELKRTKNLNLRDCLTLEHSLGRLFTYGPDIKEGIRFALTAQDGTPKWSCANLSEVTDDMVEQYFKDMIGNITDCQKNFFNVRETEYW